MQVGPKPRLKILLVEPQEQERFRLAGVLRSDERSRFEVVEAENVEIGRKRLETWVPDAVLLGADQGDPIADLRDLRSIDCGIPTIVVSMAALSNVASAILAAGADDLILRRSATKDVLRRVLSYAVERKRARVALRESEDRYRSFFEANLTGNFLCTPGR